MQLSYVVVVYDNLDEVHEWFSQLYWSCQNVERQMSGSSFVSK